MALKGKIKVDSSNSTLGDWRKLIKKTEVYKPSNKNVCQRIIEYTMAEHTTNPDKFPGRVGQKS